MTVKKGRRYYFEEASILSAIVFFAVPSVVSQLITLIYNWADTFFLGQLNNSYQISASSICHPAFMMTSAIANLFGIGGASVISRALGIKNEDRAKKMAACSILWAIITSLVYSLIVFVFQEPILSLSGASENTMQYAKDYLLFVVIIGSLPSVLNYTLAHLIRSTGKTKIASFGIILGAVSNIVLDPILIFGFSLEIMGAAIATCLANVISCIFFIVYLIIKKKETIIGFSLRRIRIKENVFSDMFSTGISSFFLTLMAIFSNISINKLTSSFDDFAVSGVSIAKKIDMLAFSISMGLSQGILPLVAYNHSSKNYDRRNKVIKGTSLIMLIFALAFVIVVFPFSDFFVSLFINHEETINYGKDFLRIMCVSMPISCLLFLLNTIFQATKETKKALTITLCRKGIVDVPLMLILNSFFPLYGIVLSQPLIDIIGMLVAIPLFISFIKKSRNEENKNIELNMINNHN